MTFRDAMCLAAVRGGLNAFAFGQTLRELERLGWKIAGLEPTAYMIDQMFTAPTDAEMFKKALAASPSVDELLAEGEKTK